ncbi:MAG: MBL fold metallo-hydrolase [Oceanobacter sp.]
MNSATTSVQSWFHEDTSTFTHLITDLETGLLAVVDPVLDFDQKSGKTSTHFMENLIKEADIPTENIKWILETHAHADHLSGAAFLKSISNAKTVVGQEITRVQKTFSQVFNEGDDFPCDGQQFDLLVKDGDELELGSSKILVLSTPGHTPACVSFLLNSQDLFVGDTLFMPDVGTARCDFPGGDAETLFQSIHRLMDLGDDVVMHLCHDYPPSDRPVSSKTTVAAQKAENIHVKSGISMQEFVTMRSTRDSGLDMPRLILPSLQVNIRAGDLPKAESNGVAYLKLPLNQF